MLISMKSSWNIRMLLPALCLVAFLICLPQNLTAATQAPSMQKAGVKLRVDVELITVEVMVCNKKGKPVPNLKKEDFELFEDGKRQEIVTFTEIKDDPSGVVPTSLADIDENSPNRGKVVLIFFDDSHLTNSQVPIARESAKKYVQQHMRPFDLFAVVSYGKSLKVLQNYTHDATKVLEAIRQPAISSALPARGMQSNPMSGQSGRRTSSIGGTNMETQESRFLTVSFFRTINSLSSWIGMVKGRKIVLFFSEDFSASPDVHTDFEDAINSARKANVAFYTIDTKLFGSMLIGGAAELQDNDDARAAKASTRGMISSLKSLSALNPLLSARSAAAGLLPGNFMFQQTGGGGQSGGGQGGGGTGGGGTGGGGTGGGGTGGGGTGGGGTGGGGTGGGGTGGGGTGSGGTGGGTGGSGMGGGTGGAGSGTGANTNPSRSPFGNRDPFSDPSGDFGRFSQGLISNMLRSLAEETGGVAIFNTNDFNGRLDELDQQFNNYYILGFQSNNPKRDGKLRALEVKSTLKGVEIRHRNGYIDPRPLDLLAGTKSEKSVMNAMASPTPAIQLPVTFRAHYFYESQELVRIPLAVRIRAASIELKKKGAQLGCDLNVMGAAYAENGSIAARFSDTLNVLIDKEQQEVFRSKEIQYRNYFKLRAGKYELKLAVADEKGKVGSAVQTLVIPTAPEGKLTASSLVLAEKLARLPELIQDLQVKLLDDDDPLNFRGLQIMPSVGHELRLNVPISALFSIYNLSDTREPRNLLAQVRLLGENGENYVLEPVALDAHTMDSGRTQARIAVNFPFKDVPPGKYKLEILASEGVSNRSVTLQADLQFK